MTTPTHVPIFVSNSTDNTDVYRMEYIRLGSANLTYDVETAIGTLKVSGDYTYAIARVVINNKAAPCLCPTVYAQNYHSNDQIRETIPNMKALIMILTDWNHIQDLPKTLINASKLFNNQIYKKCLHAYTERLIKRILNEDQFHNATFVDKMKFINNALFLLSNIDHIRQNVIDIIVHDEYKNKKAKVIQRYWFECINNPYYKVCRRRLLHEFASLTTV